MTQGNFDVLVSKTDVNANYKELSDALENGEKNILVDNGVYNITGKTVNTNGLSITGKSQTGTILNIANAFSVIPENPERSTAGTITVENRSKNVTGNGTKFKSIKANYININGLNHFIFRIKDDENLTLHFPYNGPTVENINYEIANLLDNVSFKNLTFWSSSGSGGGLIQLIDINNVIVEDVIHFKTCSPIKLKEGIRFEGVGNVNVNRYKEMGTPSQALSLVNCLNATVSESILGNAGTGIHIGKREKEHIDYDKGIEDQKPQNSCIIVNNCQINSCGTGVLVNNYSGVRLENNVISNCMEYLELINDESDSNSITIVNNHFRSSSTNNQIAVRLDRINSSAINNNIIENMRNGISIQKAEKSFVTGNFMINVTSGVEITQDQNCLVKRNLHQ